MDQSVVATAPDPFSLPPHLYVVAKGHSVATQGSSPARLPLVVATGNVLTLDPREHKLASSMGLAQTAKMQSLQDQLVKAGIAIFG
eukprot:6282067-Lingulodinium_polyedra.AAC.1